MNENMNNENANLAVVQDAYAAFGRGDVAALLGFVDPAVDWHCAGPASTPWAGSFHGHDEVRQFFAAIGSTIDFDSFAPETFVCQGDHVVALGSAQARVKRNGRVIQTQFAHAFVLKNGKVCSFRDYEDSAAVAAALAD